MTIDSSAAIDLESIALHELGHALGLAHSKERGAAMAAGARAKRTLSDDDQAGICAIYRPPS